MANQLKLAPRKVPQRGYQVNMMESSNDVPDSRESDDYIFGLKCRELNDQINVFVGDTKIPMMVTSGSSCNVIDKILWLKLKNTCSEPGRLYDFYRNIYAYGSENPSKIIGAFKSDVSWGETRLKNVEFVVYDGNCNSLLVNQTVTQLVVLKILNDSDVNAVEITRDILTDYNTCFEGFGKLKDFALKLHVDDTISRVCQTLRRIPFNLRDELTGKLNELESLDIREKVNGPTNWVSPVIILPKTNNDIQLCVDMRRASTDITRIRYPIPTIEKILQDLIQSKVFSKLDVKWAYHQIVLAPDSRDITTFVTHNGLYRYKRLMFGINCAPEMYQQAGTPRGEGAGGTMAPGPIDFRGPIGFRKAELKKGPIEITLRS